MRASLWGSTWVSQGLQPWGRELGDAGARHSRSEGAPDTTFCWEDGVGRAALQGGLVS